MSQSANDLIYGPSRPKSDYSSHDLPNWHDALGSPKDDFYGGLGSVFGR